MCRWSNFTLEGSHICLLHALHGIFLNIFGMLFGLLYSSDDIETNLGPKHSFSSQGLTICRWNLSRLSSHMYKKVS